MLSEILRIIKVRYGSAMRKWKAKGVMCTIESKEGWHKKNGWGSSKKNRSYRLSHHSAKEQQHVLSDLVHLMWKINQSMEEKTDPNPGVEITLANAI